MELMIKKLIEELKEQGYSAILGKSNPDERVNVWFVIAKLEEILHTSKKE